MNKKKLMLEGREFVRRVYICYSSYQDLIATRHTSYPTDDDLSGFSAGKSNTSNTTEAFRIPAGMLHGDMIAFNRGVFKI